MFTRTTSRRPQPSPPSAAPSFAVQRFIQPKLTVGPVDDPFEREADRVAERVVSRLPAGSLLPAPSSSDTVQRQEAEEDKENKRDEEEGEMVRLKATGPPPPASGGPGVSPAVEAGIRQSEGGGRPLPEPVRGAMESSFGADFRLVRVHADSRSDQLNRSLGARAFTTGTDVFFRGGEFQPDSTLGRRLIAHELTHVVQQSRREPGGGRGIIQRDPCYISGVAGPYEGRVAERPRALIAAGREFGDTQRKAIRDKNSELHYGVMESDEKDRPLVTKDLLTHFLAEVDHIYPEDAGGGNSMRNAQLLSQYENGTVKSNRYPWTNSRTNLTYSGARVLLPEGRLAWGLAAGKDLPVIGSGAGAQVQLPAGATVPQGGVLYPTGRIIKANERLSSFMSLPASFPLAHAANAQLGTGVTLAQGFRLPADLVLPAGFIPLENITVPLGATEENVTPSPLGPQFPNTVTSSPYLFPVLFQNIPLPRKLTFPAGSQLSSALTLPERFVIPFALTINLARPTSPVVDVVQQTQVQLADPVTFAQTTANIGQTYNLSIGAARANGLAPALHDPL